MKNQITDAMIFDAAHEALHRIVHWLYEKYGEDCIEELNKIVKTDITGTEIIPVVWVKFYKPNEQLPKPGIGQCTEETDPYYINSVGVLWSLSEIE